MSKKLRAYDSKILADNYVILEQMLFKLTMLMKEAETEDLTKLPHSVIPTETLYNIAVCYAVMYEQLVEQSLLNDGHAKPSNKIH
jgi:hypothetical protein